MPDIVSSPSPNHSSRGGADIDLIVLHYTGMLSAGAAIDRLRNADAGVSAHYLIEEEGTVHAMVDEARRAHHAGKGAWKSHLDVNTVSIGIELVNPGHMNGYTDFPEPQLEMLEILLSGLLDRYSLGPEAVIGHADLAPERKEDPGERFPWHRMAAKGLALAPWDGSAVGEPPAYEEVFGLLQKIGYHVVPTHPVAAVLAFQRRFCPAELGQGLSPNTRHAIAAIAAISP